MDTHETCPPTFCLWPLHPGPCRGRGAPRPPAAGAGRARVGAPPPNRPSGRAPATGRAAPTAPPAKAAGRARVGGPPAPVPPAKKAAKKATPAAPSAPGSDEAQRGARRVARAQESNAGGAVLMLMGASSSRLGNRMSDAVMADVRMAQARDREAGGGTDNYDQALTRAATRMATMLANERGGTDAEKRHLANRIARIAEEAMRTGDVGQITALKRELRNSRVASAAALALFGLQVVDQVEMWGGPMPSFSSPSMNLAHVDCNLSVFCRNPLHPGPCKGWKGMLGKVAPGTLKLIEEERKKKLAAKQKAKAAAQAKAKKIVDAAKRGEEVDEHPNAKKKLAKKATEQILGTEESKIAEIEGKTKLTQKEMAWHANKKAAALLAANIAAGNLQSKAAQAKYRQTVRAEILAALKADNESGLTGPDSEYQKVISGWSQALSNGHADQHVKPQNEAGDALHSAVADAFHAAVLEDVKNAKTGHQGVNMKKLTKALKDIPGEPGDPEHDAAVGEAVGHSVTPEELNGGPVLPPGAASDEEANKLAAGAGQMLALSGTPDDVVNQKMAMVKEKAQKEGFADAQAAMISKTAENQAAVVAAKHADALDGFSPQGKKKFQKLLAAEMVAMLETGDGPEPGSGSLADLVMQKQAGLITADELHEKLQKKLKIKSKKQTAVTAPKAPAAGPAGGGAGAGGVDKAKASSNVVSEIDELVNDGPSGDSHALTVQAALNDPYESEAEKKEYIKSAASAKATQLMDQIGGGLSDIEKQELHSIVAGMVEGAITDPQHAPGAKNMIKNLKKKSPADLKAFAKAILPPDQAEANAKGEAGLSDDGPSTGGGPKHLSTATPPQAAAQIASQAQAAYEKLLPESDGSALATPSAIAKLQQSIESGQTPEAAAASAATALAKAFLKNKIGTSKMHPLHEAALQDALANEIHEGIVTGKFPEGGHLDKLGGAKFGFVKMKIAAKKEFDKTGGLPSGPITKTSAPIKVTSSKQDALDAALDDAFGPVSPAGAPAVQPATPPDKLVKSVKAAPQFKPLIEKAIANYEATMAGNPSDEEKAQAAHKMGGSLAGAQIFTSLEELDLSFSDLDGDMTLQMGQKLQEDWAASVASGADAPGGLAAAMPGIVADVQAAAADAQKMNGFEDGSAALNSYKHALLQAKVEAALQNTTPATVSPGGGAGAGGTGTGVNPATPATVSPIKIATNVQDVTPQASAPAGPPKQPPLTPLPPAGPAPDLASAKKVGEQKGSNPGGMYESGGKRYYVKQQKSKEHARNEAMASALYREAGVDTPPVHVSEGSVDGLSGTLTASEIVPGAQKFDPSNKAHVAAVRRGFAVDAWLGNWDVAGLSMDNIIIGADGRPHRIDLGGSLEYRAQGSPKGAKFGDTVGEIDSLRNPSLNPSSAKIFGGMSDEEMIDAMEQVEAITPDKIRAIVKAQGGDPALAEKLIRRRQDIVNQLTELREAQKNKGPLGTPDTSKIAGDIKKSLGGTKKKQTVFKPKSGYPVAQVVVEGHENNVLEFNNKVEASRHSVDAANPPTPQMTAMPAGAPKTALKYYTSNAGYSAMNGHLRKNKGVKGTTGAAKSVKDADKAFESSRLSEPITTLRGVRGNADVFGALWTSRRDQNWTGAEFLDHGYSSSSVQMGTARAFAGAPGPNAVVMRVHMPAGTRAINLGQGSQYPGEAEILLNRGARFRIVADNGYQNGARHLDVEVICDGEGCADAV